MTNLFHGIWLVIVVTLKLKYELNVFVDRNKNLVHTKKSKTLSPNISNAMHVCPWKSNQSIIFTHKLNKKMKINIVEIK